MASESESSAPGTPSNRRSSRLSTSSPVTPTQMRRTTKRRATPSGSPMTRTSNDVFGIVGKGITKEDGEIKGARLPTNNQVLRCLMYHIEDGNSVKRSKYDAAKIVQSQVVTFFEKGNIPCISEKKACERIVKLHTDNSKIRMIPVDRRSTPLSLAKVADMEKTLDVTFPMWPVNAEELIHNPEDKKFFRSMLTDRLASFGSFDKVLAGKVARRLIRDDKESARSAKQLKLSVDDSDECVSHDTEMDTDTSETLQFNSTSTRKHRRTKPGTAAFIPPDIMKNPKLVALATRMKMTPAQQSAYTQAFIEEIGGDKTKVATSYSYADRARRHMGQTIADDCRNEWKAPEFATLHWDSKLMSHLDDPNLREERLTVVVGNVDELKLLGVPKYEPGTDQSTGHIVSNLTVELLKQWNCADCVANMTFDTTASNTGHISAACVAIQQTLNRALLWSGCRHHIGEVIITHVFNDLKIETSKSPDVSLFTRFRSKYHLLPFNSSDNLSTFSSDDASEFVLKCKDDTLKVAECDIDLRRDDYKEFLELTTVYLSGSTETTFTFKRPGALHKARWMSKLIYALKIRLFEEEIKMLPPGTITSQHQVNKVREFVQFVTLIYCRWWMKTTCAVDAPWNDLQLYQQLLKYETVNKLVSQSAVKAFQRHLWYLTSEMVPVSLFSDNVPTEVKQSMAVRLLAVKPDSDLTAPQNRFGTGFGKPRFPTITTDTSLADLVDSDSWFIFTALRLDCTFLLENVEDWPECDAYKTSAEHVRALNVVNDCAERGVKLSADYLDGARSEEHYQNILQVVEYNRKHIPNMRKPGNKLT